MVWKQFVLIRVHGFAYWWSTKFGKAQWLLFATTNKRNTRLFQFVLTTNNPPQSLSSDLHSTCTLFHTKRSLPAVKIPAIRQFLNNFRKPIWHRNSWHVREIPDVWQPSFAVDGKVCSTQGQAALTAVTDVGRVCWFIMVYCFFIIGSVKFFNNLFCDLCWGRIDSVWIF